MGQGGNVGCFAVVALAAAGLAVIVLIAIVIINQAVHLW